MNAHNAENEEVLKGSLLEFQLDVLKMEIDQIQDIVGRIDEITQQVKYWTVFLWAGSISLIISSSNIELRNYLWFPAVIPLLFWMVDAYLRRRQRRFLFRNRKISEFINSKDLATSFNQKKIQNFILLDPLGLQYNEHEVKRFVNISKTMWFKSMRTFYLSLIIFTIFIQLFLYPRTITDKNEPIDNRVKIDSLDIRNQDKTKELGITIEALDNK